MDTTDPVGTASLHERPADPTPPIPPTVAAQPRAPDLGASSGEHSAQSTASNHSVPASAPKVRTRRTTANGRAADRVIEEPAFVLHAMPWRETSLIVELLTRSYGRVACVAKGAKRPRSALRGVLLSFQPLSVGFSGRHELRTLTSAEWLGGMCAPQGDGLLCGFYLNELLVRLLPRDDAHPALFDAYAQALVSLGFEGSPEACLRRFEWRLLREIGYAMDLARDAQDRPVRAEARYALLPGRGFLATDGHDPADFQGHTLLDMAAERYDSARTLAEAKRLTRTLLGRHLDGHALKTRQILMDLHKL